MSGNLDLSGAFEKLQDMLGSAEGQQQIQGMLSAFSDNAGNAGTDNSADPLCDENAEPSNASRNNRNKPSDGISGMTFEGISPEMIFKIQRIMTIVNNSKSEVGVEFLRCLKPMLKKSRREKVDNAVRLITLMKVMETLKREGGI